MSLAYVPVFSATTRSISGGRAVYPSLLTRISYQVGSPWMFDGKMFLPETGIPIRKMLCIRRLFALADPVPFTVAILKANELTEDGRWKMEDSAMLTFLRRAQSHPSSIFDLPSSQTHTESPTRTSSDRKSV